MLTTTDVDAPTTTLCPHLISDGHTDQPLALLTGSTTLEYLCPTCVADAIERQLDTETPEAIAESVSFRHCDHAIDTKGKRTACEPCMAGITGELLTRWAHIRHVDRVHAHRLLRVLLKLGTSPAAKPRQARKERYPGEFKRDAATRAERRAAGLRVKAQPMTRPPAIASKHPTEIVVVSKS
jgi:hypothetical protein